MGLINPGEVFGEMSIIGEEERTDFATAIDNCLICAISIDDFKNFIEKNQELNIKITKLIGFKLKKFSERLEELVFKEAPQRVISFILNQAKDYGKKVGDDFFLEPFLTHSDIAKLTACTRQTVNSILTQLREKDIIFFNRRKLIIRDAKKLEKMINK